MLFNSLDFLIFFPIVILLYFVLPKKIKNIWLLITSYYFYMNWNAKYALLLLLCTLITFVASHIIERVREKKNGKQKAVLVVTLLVVFGVLFYYKYFDFILNNVELVCKQAGVTLHIPEYDIILPVGISFFTFVAVGYLIDVYRGDVCAEKNILKYALFVSFFPQLLAGPIERSKNLLKQLDKTYTFHFERVRDGIYLMIWGFILKMVIADRAAIFVDFIYNDFKNQSGAALLLATIVFAFQIYGDFAGYSTVALGAAKILGFDLIENFKSPYQAHNIQEFWRSWHISLSSWFRDYLYISLGGSRCSKKRKYCNLMIVMLVSGLWHGAAWSYVFWGGLHGLYQVVSDATRGIRNRINKILEIDGTAFSHRILQIVVTFVMVDFAWLFFRAPGLKSAITIIKTIVSDFRLETVVADNLYSYGLSNSDIQLLLLAVIVLLIVDWLKARGICIREWIYKQGWWMRTLIFVGSILFILMCGIWGNAYDAQNFIYFQF